MPRLLAAAAALSLLACSIPPEQRPDAGCDEPASYLACGCGCCGMTQPASRCLYRARGDSLCELIAQDQEAAANPGCAMAGCALGIEYRFCDGDAGR